MAGAVVALLGVGTTACGSDSDSTSAVEPASSPADADEQDDTGALEAQVNQTGEEDAIVEPVIAVGATKVEYDGLTLRAHFDGNAAEATDKIYCPAINSVALEADQRILVYDDEEVDCATRNEERN